MHIDDDGQGQFEEDEVLELDNEVEDDAPDPEIDEDEAGGDEAPEQFIGFAADSDDDLEGLDDRAIRVIREQRATIRNLQRARRTEPATAPEDDPEPVIPDVPSDDIWDIDVIREAMAAREEAIREHAKWEARQSERTRTSQAATEERGKRIEQQRRALGLSEAEYKVYSAKVKDALDPNQLAVLVEATDNPAKLIAALGHKNGEQKLDMLAGQTNLARFAAMVGTMEKDVKVGKKTPPPPETRVRGATAPLSSGHADKKLAALEKEADRTGDRSKLIAYKSSLKQRAA